MKFTDKTKMATFIELVKKGAPRKAYKSVGLDGAGIKEHLAYLAEYEEVLAEPEAPKPSVVSRKPRASRVVSQVNSEVKIEDKEEESNLDLRHFEGQE